MSTEKINIAIFIILTTVTILILVLLVIGLITTYQKKRYLFYNQIKDLKLDYEKNLLTAQLEVQEDTFRNISREIHDNISLSLTLAKLNLNLFDWNDQIRAKSQLNSSIELIGNSIENLSDISRSLNSDFVISNGLLKAIENELERIRQLNLFKIRCNISDGLVELKTDAELLVFRIFQEAFNNIIKHAKARLVELSINFSPNQFCMQITDDGEGFDFLSQIESHGNGLKNMQVRAGMLNGTLTINSEKNNGTSLIIKIPINYEQKGSIHQGSAD
jgi:two-component system NarL family sensor kinase